MNEDKTGVLIKGRMDAKGEAEFSVRPPFPKAINVELNNICNHSCDFCAYSLMQRKHGNIDVAKLESLLREAYDLGARDLGLHSGAEPFASRKLEHFVAFAKSIGYQYVYISTNGSLATPKRMRAVIDAGIDSIKFSINAGNRDMYRQVHGKDDFEKVLEHLRFASEYRRNGKPYLAISFVATDRSRATADALKERTAGWIDEFILLDAANQSGQLATGTVPAARPRKVCPVPFNKVHFSWEGFLRVCCNDYENLLVIEDLNGMSLKEAFYSDRFVEFRQRHLEDRLEGTLCYNCMYDCQTPVQPLRPDLYFVDHKDDAGPPVSHSPVIFRK